MGLLLDLANILGGFLLAIGLIDRTPEVGRPLARAADTIAPFGWVIGVVALVTGGYFLIVHLLDGPALLHFEVVAIIVGLLLLRDRLGHRARRNLPPPEGGRNGTALLVAIFGIIAIIVGLEGIFVPG